MAVASGSAKKGRPAASVNYGAEELDNVLTLCEEKKPISSDDWELVSTAHNIWLGSNGHSHRRAKIGLKAKINKLANHPKPTGDPSIPEEVRRAKRIVIAIMQRAGAAAFSPDGDEIVNSVAEPGETGHGTGGGEARSVHVTGTGSNSAAPGFQRTSGGSIGNTLSIVREAAGLLVQKHGARPASELSCAASGLHNYVPLPTRDKEYDFTLFCSKCGADKRIRTDED